MDKEVQPSVIPVWSSFAYVLIGFLSLLIVCTDLYQSRQQDERLARRAMANLTHAMDNQILGILDKVDMVLLNVVSEALPLMQETHVADVRHRQVSAKLAFFLQHLPESQSLRIVGSDGFVKFDATGKLPKGNIADREYFIENKNNPDAGLVVSGAIFARFTKNWVITISRQIRSPDGQFLGLVQAAIRTEHFEKYYATLDVGKNGILSLYDKDLKNFVRSPFLEGFTGSRKISPELASLLEQGDSEGDYVAHSASDGVQRLLRFQRSDRHPFMFIVGLAMKEVMADWYKRCLVDFLILIALFYVLWMVFEGQKNRYQKAVRIAEAMTQKAIEAVEQGNRSRRDFLSVVSHELRTPLNGILGSSELLGYLKLDNDQHQLVEQIKTSGERLLRMVEDILDYVEADSTEVLNNQSPFSLGEMFESLTGKYENAAREKGLLFQTHFDRDIRDAVLGNRMRLSRVLKILCENAIKFTSAGLVHVAVEMMSNTSDRQRLKFSVRDTGIGIPTQNRKQIFGLFSQGSMGSSRTHEGLGLGLCLASKLASLLEGELSVVSDEGQGSTFSLELSLGFS